MLAAKALRVVSLRAATEKLGSPQPPMATRILVPSTKSSRADATLRKRGHTWRVSSRNVSALINARATCVMGSSSSSLSGMTSCCLPGGNQCHVFFFCISMLVVTCPVRYMRQIGLRPLLLPLAMTVPAHSQRTDAAIRCMASRILQVVESTSFRQNEGIGVGG